ncbi:MAG: LPS export ABC transporter ATP-binding protein [Nitrospirae bacterium]|nr:LPS export ABC transporter ATP-binding protein [Nitrospirota bacterium]
MSEKQINYLYETTTEPEPTALESEVLHTLRAEGLIKSYRNRKVVNDVSILVRAGEVVGLLGPNGAGKTTTFYMMVGLTEPDEGKIFLDGEDIAYLPMYKRARKGIGYLPQEPSIFRKLTVRENIMAILETLNLSNFKKEMRLRSLLSELNITHLERNKGYALSGGERRRVEITRALVTSPSFMLLDEPFSGIDPLAVIEIQKIISRLKEKGIGMLITDHNVRETLAITDKAYIINEGIIVESGTPEEIIQSPKARKVYLGDKFRL